ncbi:DUF4367 domain-containing protein [Paenibacillus sp. J5C_2022]|uniref:DUF4367 domain-containing protein n=1 Tax=Paenibacillus sp. J5C2022 TaxID=2977129 RepID=UPI0021D0FF4C|nr:DUF4367 domain-containing protein [Paenibacillus sp. J5C2022]MCU6707298.1 DUF4367 domain-containing protein [Paenibacillus sp. J5C2022]
MTDMDRILREQLRKEADDILFSRMELSSDTKSAIRRKAAEIKGGRNMTIMKRWKAGLALLAAAVMIFAAYPLLQQTAKAPNGNPAATLPPSNGGVSGSDLSQLLTTKYSSIDEAREAFGPELHVPGFMPERFTLAEITTAGMSGEPLRDAVLTYASGEQALTFLASRMQAGYPLDMFTKVQVGDAEGYVFEQPNMTELYWVVDGIHYSITGPVTAEEALRIAQSLES